MPKPNLPEGLPSAWLLDCEIFAEAIRPDEELTITEWADKYRILPEGSAEPGPWRTARVPHAAEIMDELSPSSPTTEVTFVAGTQVAKTEIGNNFVGYVIDVAPGPIMMVYPTSNTGKRTSKTRLAKMIDAMPRLREKISENSRDRSNSASLKQFPGGDLVIAGANSASELKSMPVRYLFEDELDEYPDDVDGQGPADALAEKRTDTYSRKKKIYRASTTTRKKSSKIWSHLQRSDLRRRWLPCPHCTEKQVLRWEKFRWETKKRWEVVRDDDGEIVEVPAGTEGAKPRDTGELLDVWYECEHCAARIDEHHKEWMLPRGEWIAERPHVRGHAGFHLPAYYSPLGWYSWREVVSSRLLADRDPTGLKLQAWMNTVAAEPWESRAESISDLEIKHRATEEPKPYRLKTVPAGGLLLVAAVDVQGNRLEVKVKAYGRDKESWLVDYEIIHGDTETSAPWDALDEYLKARFTSELGASLPITATAVDSGYRTQTVYDWCRTRRHRHIFPVKGQTQQGKRILGQPTKQDIDHQGRRVPHGVDLWPVGSDTAKVEIYARLKIKQAGPGCMHFPLGLPDEYYRGLVAEKLVTRYVKGFLKTQWEKDETERNEPLDLEVYCYAAAMYAGLTRINWDRLEAAHRATAGDLFVAAERERADAEPVQTSASTSDAGTDAAPHAPAVRPRANNWVTGWRR